MCISFFSLLIKSRLVYTRVRTLCAELGQGPQGSSARWIGTNIRIVFWVTRPTILVGFGAKMALPSWKRAYKSLITNKRACSMTGARPKMVIDIHHTIGEGRLSLDTQPMNITIIVEYNSNCARDKSMRNNFMVVDVVIGLWIARSAICGVELKSGVLWFVCVLSEAISARMG